MLNQDGELTDIGSWYLGGAATDNVPSGSGSGAGRVVGSSALYMAALSVVLLVL